MWHGDAFTVEDLHRAGAMRSPAPSTADDAEVVPGGWRWPFLSVTPNGDAVIPMASSVFAVTQGPELTIIAGDDVPSLR
jgi:hypothetical protein